MKPGRIELTSKMTTADLTSVLRNRGVLRVDKNSTLDNNGVTHVFLRERMVLEAIKDFFTLDSKTLTKPALEAHKAIESVLKNNVNAGQLLQNIQERIQHKGNFSGRAIVRDLDEVNRSASGKLMPLKGGTAVAESVGWGVHVLQKNPLQVKSAFAMVHSAASLANLKVTEQTSVGFVMSKPEGVGADNLVVLTDPPVNADKHWDAHVDNYKTRLKEALTRASTTGGAIVIEMSPAMFKVGEAAVPFKQQRQLMTAMIRVVNTSLKEAKKNSNNMAVTFAGEDRQLLAIFKSQFEAERLGLNEASNKKNKPEPEDESESDEDDNVPLVLDSQYRDAVLAKERRIEPAIIISLDDKN